MLLKYDTVIAIRSYVMRRIEDKRFTIGVYYNYIIKTVKIVRDRKGPHEQTTRSAAPRIITVHHIAVLPA